MTTEQNRFNPPPMSAKAVVKISAMPAQMQADACAAATEALERFYEENDVAGFVKAEFEKKVCSFTTIPKINSSHVLCLAPSQLQCFNSFLILFRSCTLLSFSPTKSVSDFHSNSSFFSWINL